MPRKLLLAVGVAFVVPIATAIAVLQLASSGHAAVPREQPSAFIARVVTWITTDRYDLAWAHLYAAGQAVAPKREYVACELRTPIGWSVRDVSAVRVRERLARVPGVARRTRVEFVTLRIRMYSEALAAEGAFTHTFHAVSEGSHWAWIFTPSRYAMYRDDACSG
jgi:hypothetical protein